MSQYYTSTEFAKQIGVVKNTLLNWEKKGLLLPHHTSPTGRRYYTQEQVDEYFKKSQMNK